MMTRLTSFSHGAGCACKLGPSELAEVFSLVGDSFGTDRDLLVGMGTNDDAAVYLIDDARALVFTTDFFTPIVDDPYDWGRIAAANAFSDVYAMGGKPLMGVNIAGWPRDALPLEMLARVLQGGAAVARAAGALVVGGHTIDDREPKYGMAVVGLVDPARIVTNAGARSGDVLLLTKPIGTGVITTALKNESASGESIDAAVRSMTALNDLASQAMTEHGASAATDVTGFGLLGHLHELLLASKAAATLQAASVPLLDGARALVEAGQIAGGTRRNRTWLAESVTFGDTVDEPSRWLLCDAQTSGGLLIACPAERAGPLAAELQRRQVGAWRIGAINEGSPGSILVT